jgi:hypothetical protein
MMRPPVSITIARVPVVPTSMPMRLDMVSYNARCTMQNAQCKSTMQHAQRRWFTHNPRWTRSPRAIVNTGLLHG